MKKKTLIVTDIDRHRLQATVEAARMDPRLRPDYPTALEAELGKARIVPAGKVPPDVVTMNSVVRLCDVDSGEVEDYELVFPAHADVSANRISVLAPVGTAILGYRVGDVIEWRVPAGLRRLRVEELLHQPQWGEVMQC